MALQNPDDVMSYKGTIIEESLSDKSLMKKFKIVSTRVEVVTERHNTPWVDQWTLHVVEIPDESAQSDAELLSKSIDTTHKSSWYADYKNKDTHYIIFPGRIFKINRSKPSEYVQVKRFGASLGIPPHQLDFSPNVE